MNKGQHKDSDWPLLCKLASFAVISLVCCYRFSSSHCLLSCDCEGFSTYAIFNFTELVDVDFCRFFTCVLGTFNLDDGSWSCPRSSKKFNFFFTVFFIIAGKKHTKTFNTFHFTWCKVSSDKYMLTKKFFFF